MPDNRTYPRFGGDRKYDGWTLTEKMGIPDHMRDCECCKPGTVATHLVHVQFSEDWEEDKTFAACPFHVGQARRFHTFEKFLAAAEGRDA